MPAEQFQPHVLGTAQLGMRYGVANTTGQPTRESAHEMIRAAIEGKVYAFDTAQGYGCSEDVLGDAIVGLGAQHQVRVITKIKSSDPADLEELVTGSIRRLRIDSLWGLMLHEESDIDRWHCGLGAALCREQAAGRVHNIGVSVYTPERAEAALSLGEISIIQVPTNIFDRRFIRSGFFERAATAGKRVFIRSVFLQGIVGMKPALAAASNVPFARLATEAIEGFCLRHQLEAYAFALNYVRDRAPTAHIVLGAETEAQVRQNCRRFQQSVMATDLDAEWDTFWPSDVEDLIDPRRWPKRAPQAV